MAKELIIKIMETAEKLEVAKKQIEELKKKFVPDTNVGRKYTEGEHDGTNGISS